MIRKVYNEFSHACILGVTVEHNGYQGGDAGHGGFVEITFINKAGTCMDCEKITEGLGSVEQISLTFRGSAERATLLGALKTVVKELEENPYLPNDDNNVKKVNLSALKDEFITSGDDPEVDDNY